jgi:hypothetical protein
MNTPTRKLKRLLEKLKAMDGELLRIKGAPKGTSNPKHPEHDADAHYISRATLIFLLEDDFVEDDCHY